MGTQGARVGYCKDCMGPWEDLQAAFCWLQPNQLIHCKLLTETADTLRERLTGFQHDMAGEWRCQDLLEKMTRLTTTAVC